MSRRKHRRGQATGPEEPRLDAQARTELERAVDLLDTAWVLRVGSGVLLVPLALLFGEAFNTPLSLLFPLVWLGWAQYLSAQARALVRKRVGKDAAGGTRRELQGRIEALLAEDTVGASGPSN